MASVSLDDPQIYDRLDSHGLLSRIAALPAQIEEAWAAARALELPDSYRGVERVAVAGMGGSGIGGLLLEALAVGLGAPVPVSVVRGYRLPAWVDGRTLVIAASNSGNTEETLAVFEAASDARAKCLAVTTGGKLLALANQRGVPSLQFAWSGEPRSALGWSFASVLAICSSLALIPADDTLIANAVTEMRAFGAEVEAAAPEDRNPAKQLARRLYGRLPVFIAAEALAPVAYRWRTQVNENAKSWAIADELPEMNHNAQQGYGLPQRVIPLLHAVVLRHDAMHPRIRLRVEATVDEMRRAGVSVEVVDVRGGDVLAQILRAVWLGDYASYYLGLLNGVEPSPVTALDRLKAFMSSR